ncbi:CRISPR-associated endoribonuclease Cas6 [Streptomyces sp. LP05-1]|uniref:CRISPR-associated endoribonuclease Cas6 n=1 Tax=Streptomyces pyxinae TaxID=2970734 RepID=A0ABT2CP40_9ACTN|nr:CRISPR-associated endoribonuclease Cas6 [Streptomyces sp. LP05-1]MCS0639189.1 CRISPR-associated endoribonuclease Cas6 [Streptomyces sp. LP05-1]
MGDVVRVKVDVGSDVPSLPWEDVHGPARAVVYGLLGSEDAELARALHDEGWAGQPLKPLGLTVPLFRGTQRRKGVYAASGDGTIWFGSPVPEIVSVLVAALAGRAEIRWGTARLRLHGFNVEVGGASDGGYAELSTATPVVVKRDSRYLLPGEQGFEEVLLHNLAHKADVLGLPVPSGLRVLEAGPRRRFTVRGAPRIGAQVRVVLEADGRLVKALRSWGLGLDNVQGFGWVR